MSFPADEADISLNFILSLCVPPVNGSNIGLLMEKFPLNFGFSGKIEKYETRKKLTGDVWTHHGRNINTSEIKTETYIVSAKCN